MNTPNTAETVLSALNSADSNEPQAPTMGSFTNRKNTVIAGVLASLLEQRNMTGLGAVRQASTTRLAGHIHRVRTYLGWPVITTDRVVDTSDGRTETIAEYSLPEEVIRMAFCAGAESYCNEVKSARAALRMSKAAL